MTGVNPAGSTDPTILAKFDPLHNEKPKAKCDGPNVSWRAEAAIDRLLTPKFDFATAWELSGIVGGVTPKLVSDVQKRMSTPSSPSTPPSTPPKTPPTTMH